MTVEAPEQAPERQSWNRPVVIGASVIVVLLVGAVIGMFLTQRALDSGTPATPAAGSVEVGFAQDMSVHHEQAVTMANWERDHTQDPQLKQLAFDIESSQTQQIGVLRGWLMLWDQPAVSSGEYMTWMAGAAGHDHGMAMTSAGVAAMPGMATDAELARLRSLTGKDLDVYFLQLMLRHHQGGAPMAQYAHDHTSVPAVKTLAQNILSSQGNEVTLMQQMLAARGAQPL